MVFLIGTTAIVLCSVFCYHEVGFSVLNRNETAEEAISIMTETNKGEERGDISPSGERSDFKNRYSYPLTVLKPVIAAINGPATGLIPILNQPDHYPSEVTIL
jgi:hypothetical protein